MFKLLKENELYLKKEKCSFAKEEVYFLGHKIKNEKLYMDKAKVKGSQKWNSLTKVGKLQIFLSFMNYHKPFIKEYFA